MSAVILFCFCLWSLFGVFGCEFVSVTEGDSVILSVNLTEHQMKEEISWKFGAQDITIAETEKKGKYPRLHEERADGRFRGRLKLDHTGSLTITNIRTDHSGLYTVITSNTETQLNIFNITIYAVIRLVLSALVGVAAVAVVVYDVRSRTDQQKKRSDQKIRSDIELNTLDSAGC
ncbi:putative SLAM family member 9-like [Triplophysa rosa]|uniref:SLAM family member 9-like n=1 Tax=Triplophysa rosa TaxID=992332 RepID=A0A9W7T2W5_TRIRA|nr:putative SLAM family member 9-like [Triplophysa rosa]